MPSFLFKLTPHDGRSGGMRAIYYLTELLKAIGCKVKINGNYENQDIVVYPDNGPGNPYNATKIVRFMCYFADTYFQSNYIPKSELVIVYHKDYLEEISTHCEVKPKHILTIPSIEPDTCYAAKKDIEVIVYVGKRDSHNYADDVPRSLAHHPTLTKINVDRLTFITFLRRAKNFYSLDYHTIACTEAALCGCNVYHVYGENEFRPVIIASPDSIVMEPNRDIALAHKLVEIVNEFFKAHL